ncbi:MAG: DUF6340 family protein [Chitinophagaceae bacterium]
MKIPVALLLAAVFFSSCASTNLVYLSVQEPAPVTIAQDIKTVAVINRSAVSKQNKILDAIDKVMTMEGPDLDAAGAEASVTGLTDALAANNRFTAVRLPATQYAGNAAPGFFPAPLSWNEVEKICAANNADAIFALELFDTDSKINYAVNQVSLKTPVGNVPGFEHQANMHTLVKTGWRIYDLRGRTVIDEYAFDRSLNYSARGINPLLAAAGLINRKEAVKEVGSQNGHAYAQRILPYWIRVYRDYYIKGSDNFTIGTRMARTGNWKGAEEQWMKETTNPGSKIAGRACYNMAIISEINGDIDKAIEWAKKSYENYNNHLALTYVNILKNRKINDTVLQEQQQQP